MPKPWREQYPCPQRGRISATVFERHLPKRIRMAQRLLENEIDTIQNLFASELKLGINTYPKLVDYVNVDTCWGTYEEAIIRGIIRRVILHGDCNDSDKRDIIRSVLETLYRELAIHDVLENFEIYDKNISGIINSYL